MAAPPDLDPSAFATLVIATFTGPALAAYIGPYAVIVIAAVAGASWALSEETAPTTRSAVLFLLRCSLTAAVLTAAITAVLERWVLAGTEARWLFAPIAFLIGWVGNDWPRFLHWAAAKAKRLAELRLKGVDRNGK